MSVDYIGSYVTSEVADLPRLINDDFLEPIKLLFTNEYYVSAAKLLMSFVDSIAYVEYGDNAKNPFIEWVVNYADLSSVGIAPEELWEHRNSLLHITNLESRKVRSGRVGRLIHYVGPLPEEIPRENDDGKLYDLHALIITLIQALEPWLQTYRDDPSKFKHFMERYDLILSDKRALRIPLRDE